jgi:hypothetical protein
MSQFFDSLPMPTRKPMMVAATMPTAATTIVLRKPTQSA